MKSLSPWEKQESEPKSFYLLFEVYLHLPPEQRSIERAWEEWRKLPARRRRVDLTLEEVERIALTYRWEDRARLFDQSRTGDLETLRRDMNARHMQVGQYLQSKGIERIRTVPLEEIPIAEATRLVVEGTKIERAALGEPEKVVAVQHDPRQVEKILSELRRIVLEGGVVIDGDGEVE